MKSLNEKEIIFSSHADSKFDILKQHDFDISKTTIITALGRPDKVEPGYRGRKIAQMGLDEEHVIRIIFEVFHDTLKVVTFYPARRERYED